MVRQLPLQTLIELARTSVDDTARELALLNAQCNSAEHQLGMLRDYRQDYLEKLQAAMRTGLAAADCHNYQRFIATLDDAIAQQATVLQHAKQLAQEGRERWQHAQRKLNSFETLQSRQSHAQARIDARREQRDNDEYAARLFRRHEHAFC